MVMSLPHNRRSTPTARVGRIVRIDGHSAAYPVGVLPLKGEQGVVPVRQVGRGGEVCRRSPPPAAEDRGDVNRDADLCPGGETAGVALAPVGPRRAVVVKVSVYIDQHGLNLSHTTA